MHWVLAWIVVLAISSSLAFALTAAVAGPAPGADARSALTSTSTAAQQGPSCTWIGTYCAFPDR
jgi:hypothetical protein